jgi:putative ABC transport system substrate-binding protein
MRRREFVSVVCGLAAWPLAVHAQQPQHVRRIGVLMPLMADDAFGLRRAKIFTQALQDLGWTDGQNTRIYYRWAGSDIEQIQSLAKELGVSTNGSIAASDPDNPHRLRFRRRLNSGL